MKTLSLFLFVTVFISFSAFAETRKKIQKEPQGEQVEQALRLTQEMLKDPEQRKQFIEKNSQSKATDKKVKDLAGSAENEQAMYELAASVFDSISAKADGDPEKMQQMLNEGMKNPEDFAQQWSPEQLQKLHEISENISKR